MWLSFWFPLAAISKRMTSELHTRVHTHTQRERHEINWGCVCRNSAHVLEELKMRRPMSHVHKQVLDAVGQQEAAVQEALQQEPTASERNLTSKLLATKMLTTNGDADEHPPFQNDMAAQNLHN